MKKFLIVFAACFFYCALVNAQQIFSGKNLPIPKRTIRFNFITRDSVNLAYDNNFDMIEDDCSQIMRYGHLRMPQRQFFGKIEDVSRLDPHVILTDGNYTADGLKDGYFVTHYLNGNLQAKGSFKNNQYDGKWEMYYEDGKPKLFFEANGNNIKITGAWDEKGAKTINDGKGAYRVDLPGLTWKGKLLNGLPDGTWSGRTSNDVELVSEKYKNGTFQKGSGPTGDYTDAPKLILVSPEMLPFTKAEKVHVSLAPCDGNGVKIQKIVNAKFMNGTDAFSLTIQNLVKSYFGTIDLKKYQNEIKIDIDAVVAENGNIIDLNSTSPYQDVVNGLITQLRRLPSLQPATIDGKPVKEKIVISFVLDEGRYSYSYRLLPVKTN